jgi:hypothetical protein
MTGMKGAMKERCGKLERDFYSVAWKRKTGNGADIVQPEYLSDLHRGSYIKMPFKWTIKTHLVNR